MNRTEARQLDCEIRESLHSFSIEQGLEPIFGDFILDKCLEIIPDDSKRDMIFLGEESTSYKLGNIRLDLKSVLVALVEFVASCYYRFLLSENRRLLLSYYYRNYCRLRFMIL